MKVLKKILLSYLLCSLATIQLLAHIQTTYSLEGTIGNRDVILEIIKIEDQYNAKYCFRNEKKANHMLVEYDSTCFTLKSMRYNAETKHEEISELIEISEDSSFIWHGFQKRADGTMHEIVLHQIEKEPGTEHAIKNKNLRDELSLYDYSCLKDIEYEERGIQIFHDSIKVQWAMEPLSGIMFFRFVEGFPDSTIVRLNNYLERYYIDDIKTSLNCGSAGHIGQYEQEMQICYINTKVMSVVKTIKSNCYNAKIETSYNYLNLNVEKQQIVQIEELLYIGKGSAPVFGSKEYATYRRQIFAKNVKQYITDTYTEEIKKSGCDYSNEGIYFFPLFYLSNEGLVLSINNYTLSEECNFPKWSVLRFEDFTPYWNDKYFGRL